MHSPPPPPPPSPSPPLLICFQEAKDYLKILHALIKEEWVAKEFITRADNELLYRRVPSFIDLSLRCLEYGFSSPISEDRLKSSTDPILKTVDVGLVSISLAIIFALVTLPSFSLDPRPSPSHPSAVGKERFVPSSHRSFGPASS
jgi:hypothetical protein